MNVKFYCAAAMAAVCSLSGCSEGAVAPSDGYMGNKIESGIEWSIPNWQGGEFTIDLKKEFVRWAEIGTWDYRILFDGKEVETGTTTGNSLKVIIPENNSDSWRKIVVEGLLAETPGGSPKWICLASSEQPHPMVEIDGVYWTPSNLTLKDGKFSFTGKPEAMGLYFKHMSLYGVLSDGDAYSGKCYTPEEKMVALADIPQKDGDPCMVASEGKLRLPSRYEIEKLFNSYDYKQEIKNGVTGLSFGEGKLFLPLAGGYDMTTGQIGYKNTNGAYWYSGEETDGLGGLLVYIPDLGLTMSYNYGAYTASVRCVRNTQKPTYVSHTPLNSNQETEIDVVTTPGDLDEYTVVLMDGNYEISAIATKENPVAKLVVPENTDIDEITYTLFVNGDPTGQKIVQPGLTNYVFYQSHTPKGTVAPDAFTLSVTCMSDMDVFDVEVKTDDGSVALKQSGSKSNLTVHVAVPANETTADRTLKIYVDGKYTNRNVVQEKPAFILSMVWSPGYLTVKDGVYTFAGEQERGMYFKYKSRYGMVLDKEPGTASNYTGTAYGPTGEVKTYAEIPYDDVDPCLLVVPAGTWRMPTFPEWEELFALEYELSESKYRMFYDAEQKVYLTPSGQLKNTGKGVLSATVVRVWSSSVGVKDPAKQSAVAYALLSSSKPTNSEATHDVGLMVRCLRSK